MPENFQSRVSALATTPRFDARKIPYIGADKPMPPVAGSGSMAQEEVEGIRERRVLCCLVSRLIIQRF